ncbi:ATAD3, partial [Symbiodinium necroappetens]
ADSFLRRGRGGEGTMGEDARNSLSVFLHHTGTESARVAVILATNVPTVLDRAVLDRVDEEFEFPRPAFEQRNQMLRLFIDQYLLRSSKGGKSLIEVDAALDDKFWEDVYNLCLLVHRFRGTHWGQHVLPFLGFRIWSSNCSVAASELNTVAISEAGELAGLLVCVGDNYRGQCDPPPDLGPVVAVAAGNVHTCAVKTSGELVCFGNNRYDQCDVPPDLGPVVAVAAGGYHTCAVKASGELVCFGSNRHGQRDVPRDLGPVVAVAAGALHTCAVKASGELVCFGCNETWQCDVPPDLGPVLAVAVGLFHTCAVKASGELVCFGCNKYGQCDVPADLGPVVAVAAGNVHTCAVKTSGELVCFGNNDSGKCDVPPDLGPVVAVAAGGYHSCAVKASGELVCFGNNDSGQCDFPPGFKVLLAPQSIGTPTPDPTQEVLQPVHHSEPAADISEEESAAIVAEQEASWIEHNIGSGWHGDELQPGMSAGLTRVVHLTLSRSHRRLDEDLEHSVVLQPYRQALEEEGLAWRLQPSGAKIFMEPFCFRAIRSHLSTMRLRPCDIFVSETLENEVVRVIRQIPRSLGVIPRSSQSIAFADEDGEVVLVSRSFLNIPAGMFLSPASVVQSTTEDVAKQTEGMSGRQLAKLVLAFQSAVFGSGTTRLTQGLAQTVLQWRLSHPNA